MKIGYNTTDLVGSLFNNKGNLLTKNFDMLMSEMPDLGNSSIRFPGGAISRAYDFDLPGLGQAKTAKKENDIYPFIRLQKLIGFSVVPVLNMNKIFFEPENEDKWMDKNMRMIQTLVDANISIDYINIGNEIQMHSGVENAINGGYEEKPSLRNRMRKTNQKIEEAFQRYFYLSEWTNEECKKRFPSIKTASVIAGQENARDRRFNQIFKNTSTDAVDVHFYINEQNITKQKETVLRFLQPAIDTGKEVIVTEANWNFGSDGISNLKDEGTFYHQFFLKNVTKWCEEQDVKLFMWHRLNGKKESPRPYDLVLF